MEAECHSAYNTPEVLNDARPLNEEPIGNTIKDALTLANEAFPPNKDTLTNVEIVDDSIVCSPSVIIVPDQLEAEPLLNKPDKERRLSEDSKHKLLNEPVIVNSNRC